MSIDDLLLQASSNWSDVPETFTSGLLGDVGVLFREAFDAFVVDRGVNASSLTFEYLVGLLFFSTYGTLQGLKNVIAHWLIGADLEFTLPANGYSPPHNYEGPEPWGETVSLYETGEMLWRSSGAGWSRKWKLEGPNDFRWGDYRTRLILYRERRQPLYYVEATWYGRSIIGEQHFMSSGIHPDWDFDLRIDAAVGGEAPEFTPTIREGLERYITAELAVDREYPTAEETAATDNGFMFANWCEGRFGEPT